MNGHYNKVKLPVLSMLRKSSLAESREKTIGSFSPSLALMTATEEPKRIFMRQNE